MHRNARRRILGTVHQNEIKYSRSKLNGMFASYFSSQPPRSRSSACAAAATANACSATSRPSLRENSRKSGRRAMYAKWRGRPWRKPKLSDKFSCDAGRAATSRGNQRGPGVTFGHVDYNCDLCWGLCPFLSLSLSLRHLLVLVFKRSFIPSHPFTPLSSALLHLPPLVPLLYQRRFHRRRPMIEYALGYYSGVLPNFEEYVRAVAED